jgi:superfamily II DNA or RNA helicase
MYELRDYQTEAIESINNIEKGEVGLISLPTGAGKGVIISQLASQIEGRTLIIVPSKELRIDMIDKLKSIDENIDVGSVQSTLDQISNKIVISTRQSLTSNKSTRIERMLQHGNFELVFMDEAHQAVDQLQKILNQLDTSQTRVIGLTATPWNESMIKIFSKINYSKDILWMIKNKYLCQPKVYNISTETDIDSVKTVAGEFNIKDLQDKINSCERNDTIVKGFKKYASDRKHVLAFCASIDHSRDLCEEFNRQGIKCKTIDNTLSPIEREQTLKDFKNGSIQVLCNIGVLTTGFDFKPVDCIIYARPTKSKILYVQILGRGLRTFEHKENCLVLDFKDVSTKHNIMDMSSIFDIDFENGETIDEAENRKEKQDAEEKERQEKEKLRLEELRKQEEELIAKEIDIFNNDMEFAIKENAYYDWFKIGYNMYSLSQECDLHYSICKSENGFETYIISTEKDNQYTKELESFNNILNAINYIENEKLYNARSFAYKSSKWKSDEASSRQLSCIKFNNGNIKTKWDCHKYFKSWVIKKLIQNAC